MAIQESPSVLAHPQAVNSPSTTKTNANNTAPIPEPRLNSLQKPATATPLGQARATHLHAGMKILAPVRRSHGPELDAVGSGPPVKGVPEGPTAPLCEVGVALASEQLTHSQVAADAQGRPGNEEEVACRQRPLRTSRHFVMGSISRQRLQFLRGCRCPLIASCTPAAAQQVTKASINTQQTCTGQ